MQASKAKGSLWLGLACLGLLLIAIVLVVSSDSKHQPVQALQLDVHSPLLAQSLATAVARQLKRRFEQEDRDLENVSSSLLPSFCTHS
jgi:hypothetical protein